MHILPHKFHHQPLRSVFASIIHTRGIRRNFLSKIPPQHCFGLAPPCRQSIFPVVLTRQASQEWGNRQGRYDGEQVNRISCRYFCFWAHRSNNPRRHLWKAPCALELQSANLRSDTKFTSALWWRNEQGISGVNHARVPTSLVGDNIDIVHLSANKNRLR